MTRPEVFRSREQGVIHNTLPSRSERLSPAPIMGRCVALAPSANLTNGVSITRARDASGAPIGASRTPLLEPKVPRSAVVALRITNSSAPSAAQISAWLDGS